MGDMDTSTWGIIFGAIVAIIVVGIVLDHLREKRDLKQHLKRIDERKEAYERFKQKKRSSQETHVERTQKK